jgi:hypothetical protein
MSDYDEAVLANQFPIVKAFVYHLIYYRIALHNYQKRQLKNEFWTLTIDAHVLRAAINWCMVFGANSEQTHWKRLVKHSEAEIQSFREGLFRATGLNGNGWLDYWTSMTRFRDKFVAHRELELFLEPVPDFNIALAVAYHYDNWLRHSIAPGHLGGASPGAIRGVFEEINHTFDRPAFLRNKRLFRRQTSTSRAHCLSVPVGEVLSPQTVRLFRNRWLDKLNWLVEIFKIENGGTKSRNLLPKHFPQSAKF